MVIAVLLGSVRHERLGARVAAWVIRELRTRGHEPVLVDPAALNLALLDKMWKEVKSSEAPEDQPLRHTLTPIAELYTRADGFCIVSAEYNHSAPPALVNLVDYFLEEYFYKPSAIVSYSATPFGGVRGAISLRALLAEAGMSSIPSIQPVPAAGDSLSETGIPLTAALTEKSGPFFTEFEWYMRALKAERDRTPAK